MLYAQDFMALRNDPSICCSYKIDSLVLTLVGHPLGELTSRIDSQIFSNSLLLRGK